MRIGHRAEGLCRATTINEAETAVLYSTLIEKGLHMLMEVKRETTAEAVDKYNWYVSYAHSQCLVS